MPIASRLASAMGIVVFRVLAVLGRSPVESIPQIPILVRSGYFSFIALPNLLAASFPKI